MNEAKLFICEKRQRFLDHAGHSLVLGGPGSGKTTIALLKAQVAVTTACNSHQSVLFLSFSRAAIQRLLTAASTTFESKLNNALSMQTFHSFFWSLIQPHAYLLGLPKKVSILLPHDEKSLSNGVKEGDLLWSEWLLERNRLCRVEGRITFDSFAQLALELLSRSSYLRGYIRTRHPLIVVDEAQDTSPLAWECIKLLSVDTPVVCLADIEQQIFDHLPGIGPERIDEIRRSLNPLEIDLSDENNRSPGFEIAKFASDVRKCKTGGPYAGVGSLLYNWRVPYESNTIRRAIAIVSRAIRSCTGEHPKSLAILTPYGSSAAKLSFAMNSWDKPVRHRFLCDEVEAILAARFCAFLLERKVSK